MIRWLITITEQTMISRWPSVGDKFSLDLDQKGRLVKHYGKFVKTVGCRRWNYSWRAGSTERISVPWNVAFKALPFA